MARPILETTIEVNGTPFTLFNNHWKSGASSPEMEKHRIQNATTLRMRIDDLTAKDPKVDFIVGGDLNSHYNQSTVYADQMKKTGINQVLLSMGKQHRPGATGRNYTTFGTRPCLRIGLRMPGVGNGAHSCTSSLLLLYLTE